jgi:hypothetical protein
MTSGSFEKEQSESRIKTRAKKAEVKGVPKEKSTVRSILFIVVNDINYEKLHRCLQVIAKH